MIVIQDSIISTLDIYSQSPSMLLGLEYHLLINSMTHTLTSIEIRKGHPALTTLI